MTAGRMGNCGRHSGKRRFAARDAPSPRRSMVDRGRIEIHPGILGLLASLEDFRHLVGASLIDRPGERRMEMGTAMIERNHTMLADHDVWEVLG